MAYDRCHTTAQDELARARARLAEAEARLAEAEVRAEAGDEARAEAEAKARLAEAEARARAEAEARQAEARARAAIQARAEAEDRAAKAEDRAAKAEDRAKDAEDRAAQGEASANSDGESTGFMAHCTPASLLKWGWYYCENDYHKVYSASPASLLAGVGNHMAPQGIAIQCEHDPTEAKPLLSIVLTVNDIRLPIGRIHVTVQAQSYEGVAEIDSNSHVVPVHMTYIFDEESVLNILGSMGGREEIHWSYNTSRVVQTGNPHASRSSISYGARVRVCIPERMKHRIRRNVTQSFQFPIESGHRFRRKQKGWSSSPGDCSPEALTRSGQGDIRLLPADLPRGYTPHTPTTTRGRGSAKRSSS